MTPSDLRLPDDLINRSATEWVAVVDEKERKILELTEELKVSHYYVCTFEKALQEIATLCGYKPSVTCSGLPEDIDELAVRLVMESLDEERNLH